MKGIETIKNFLKSEDPIVWKSLIVAAIVTIGFYIFVLAYTRANFGVKELVTFLILFTILALGVYATFLSSSSQKS